MILFPAGEPDFLAGHIKGFVKGSRHHVHPAEVPVMDKAVGGMGIICNGGHPDMVVQVPFPLQTGRQDISGILPRVVVFRVMADVATNGAVGVKSSVKPVRIHAQGEFIACIRGDDKFKPTGELIAVVAVIFVQVHVFIVAVGVFIGQGSPPGGCLSGGPAHCRRHPLGIKLFIGYLKVRRKRGEFRFPGDDVDQPGMGITAIQGPLPAPEQFHTFHIQQGIRGHIGNGHIIQVHVIYLIHVGGAPDAPEGVLHAMAVHAVVIDVRGNADHLGQVVYCQVLQGPGLKGTHTCRQFLFVGGNFICGHRHRFQLHRVIFALGCRFFGFHGLHLPGRHQEPKTHYCNPDFDSCMISH